MSIETSPLGVLAIIAVMALVTLATRWGGPFLMSYVTINPRIESFINTMASSVLIAILTPMAITGDLGARVALGTTGLMMLVLHKPLPSIAAGIAAAAAARYFF
ncbi:AzlD domain-containing protein [Marinobacter sp. R17]|uniref:AzlD family protein n=1 Tax=Marinobacter sp. R17 TaxID=2484250 RepID=UPI000F4B0ACA|nr:AzlD domain-containing protein [Marinobacter sp. R17]ROT98764.1 AzlD domain-containing protein [Marinobacter sp. R17]